MKCENLQREITTQPAGSAPLSEEMRRHLDDCVLCAETAAQSRRLEEALSGWRSQEPPAGLQSQISAALPKAAPEPAHRAHRFTLSGPRRQLSWRSALPAAAAATLMIAACLALGPQGHPANALQQIDQAMRSVVNAHVIYRQAPDERHLIPGQPLQTESEFWYQNDMWRIAGHGGAHLIRDHRDYSAQGNTGQVQSSPQTYQPVSDFTVEGFLKHWWGDTSQASLLLIGKSVEQGRTVRQMLFVPRPGYYDDAQNPKKYFWIDDATNLPIRLAAVETRDGQTETLYEVDFRFNERLPKGWFDPRQLK